MSDEKAKKRTKAAQMINAQAIISHIDNMLSEEFADHARTAMQHEKGATLDIYIHEDLDELQALDIDNLADNEKAEPMARLSFMGMRGRGRIRLMNLFCTALTNAGFTIRHKGITRF